MKQRKPLWKATLIVRLNPTTSRSSALDLKQTLNVLKMATSEPSVEVKAAEMVKAAEVAKAILKPIFTVRSLLTIRPKLLGNSAKLRLRNRLKLKPKKMLLKSSEPSMPTDVLRILKKLIAGPRSKSSSKQQNEMQSRLLKNLNKSSTICVENTVSTIPPSTLLSERRFISEPIKHSCSHLLRPIPLAGA